MRRGSSAAALLSLVFTGCASLKDSSVSDSVAGVQDSVEIRLLEDGRAILIEVSDSGAGVQDSLQQAFETIAASSEKHEGLFTLYQDSLTGSLHIAIAPDQIDREFIYFIPTVDGVPAAVVGSLEAEKIKGTFATTGSSRSGRSSTGSSW